MDILEGLPPPPNPPTINSKKQSQIIRSFSNDNSSSYKYSAGGGSSKTPPLTPSKKKNSKVVSVKIVLLDDTVTIIQVQIKTIGRLIFDQICKQLNILECDYFGLEYVDSSGTPHYIDFEKKLNHQVGLNLNEPLLKFVVKFYTPDPLQLEEEFTRYLFSLQIRKDLATGLLQCNDNTAALMASYLVQAECGDFNEEDYPNASYLNKHLFVPNQDYEIENRIRENHKKHVGQSPAEADLHLLEVARRTEFYGIKLHPAKDEDGVVLNLSVSHMGILIFQGSTKINIFSWSKIRKISFKRKRFLLKLHPEGYGYYKETIDFNFEGRNECKAFWKRCVEHHSFFRCDKAPLPSSASRSKGLLNSRGSSFRYSGRTQKQMVSFVRENFIKRSVTPSSMKNPSPSMQQRVLPSSFQRSSSFRSTNNAEQSGVSTSCSSPAMIISSNDRIIEINSMKHDSDSQPEDTISPGTSINSSPQHNAPLYYHHHEGLHFPHHQQQQQQGQTMYNSAQSITSYTYENEFPITTYKSQLDAEGKSGSSKGTRSKPRSKSLVNKKSTDTLASSTKECHDTTSHGSYDLLDSADHHQYEFNEFVPYLLRRRIDLDASDLDPHTKLYKSKSFSNTINKKKVKLAKYLSYNSIGYYYSWQDDTCDFDESFDNSTPLPRVRNARNEKNNRRGEQNANEESSAARPGVSVDPDPIVTDLSEEEGKGDGVEDEVYELSEEGGDEEDVELTEEVKPPALDPPEEFELSCDEMEDELTEEAKEEEPYSKSDEVNDEELDRSDEVPDRILDDFEQGPPELEDEEDGNNNPEVEEFEDMGNEYKEENEVDIEFPGGMDDVIVEDEDMSKSDEIYEQDSYKSEEVEDFPPEAEEELLDNDAAKPEVLEVISAPKPMLLTRDDTLAASDEITDEELVEPDVYEREDVEELKTALEPHILGDEVIYETLKMEPCFNPVRRSEEDHIYESLVKAPEELIVLEKAPTKGSCTPDLLQGFDRIDPRILAEIAKKSVKFDFDKSVQEEDEPEDGLDIVKNTTRIPEEQEPLKGLIETSIDEAIKSAELEEGATATSKPAANDQQPTSKSPLKPHKQVMFFIEEDEDSDTATIESERIRLDDFNKMKLLLNQLENLKEVQKSDDYPTPRTVLPEIKEDEDSVESGEPQEITSIERVVAKIIPSPAAVVAPSPEVSNEPVPGCSKTMITVSEPTPGPSKVFEPLPPSSSPLMRRGSSSDSEDAPPSLERIPEGEEPQPVKVLYFENKCLPERSFPTKQLETLVEEESPEAPPAIPPHPASLFAPNQRKSSTPSLDELPLPPTPPFYEIEDECETPKYPLPPNVALMTDTNARRFSYNKSRSSTDSSEQRKKLSRTFSIESDELPVLPIRTSSSSTTTKSSSDPNVSDSDNSSSEHSPDVTNITTNLFINFPNYRTLSRISERTHSSEECSDASSNFVRLPGNQILRKNQSVDLHKEDNDDDVSGLTINTVPLVTLTSELCDSSATLNDFEEIGEEEVRESNVELHRAYLNLNVVNGEIQF